MSNTKLMEARIRHLQNELQLLQQEYEKKAQNYYELYSRMEEKVEERTAELRELHQRLEMKNRQLEIIFDSSPVMIFYLNARGEYVRVNKRFARMLGLSVRDIVGKSYSQLFPHAPYPFGDDGDVISNGRPVFNLSCRMKSTEGDRELIVDKIPSMNGEGKVNGIIGFATDVTELKRAEDDRRALQQKVSRAEKMEAIGLLAGGVAHDGNNILTGISGYLELLNMRIPPGDPNRKYIQGTLEAARKMGHLIDDLLTLTRSMVTQKRVLNLNEVVRDFLSSAMCRSLLREHPEIRFEENLPLDLQNIRGVSNHLTKLLMNLVTNAAEAMPEGGTIRISTADQQVDQPIQGYDRTIEKGRYVVLSVSDTGTGIGEEDLGRIFEPFFTTKQPGKSGTGLGIALVYGIVKDHRGFINVRSTTGEGTTFSIYFPATRETAEEKTGEDPGEEYRGRGQRILVVDDVESQRKLLSEILTRLGYAVQAVPCGEAAIDYLQDHPADLVILDMIMEPGIDGLDTYRRLLQINPRQKVLIISGYARTERVAEAQRLGAGQYVKKPYTLEKIGKAVRDELAR